MTPSRAAHNGLRPTVRPIREPQLRRESPSAAWTAFGQRDPFRPVCDRAASHAFVVGKRSAKRRRERDHRHVGGFGQARHGRHRDLQSSGEEHGAHHDAGKDRFFAAREDREMYVAVGRWRSVHPERHVLGHGFRPEPDRDGRASGPHLRVRRADFSSERLQECRFAGGKPEPARCDPEILRKRQFQI